MTGEPQGDGYTLGLLVDLRALCTKIGDSHYRMAAELHDLPLAPGRQSQCPRA
jgi:hypothetical protein